MATHPPLNTGGRGPSACRHAMRPASAASGEREVPSNRVSTGAARARDSRIQITHDDTFYQYLLRNN